MNIDLKNVNIADANDFKRLEEVWNEHFDFEHSFEPYKEKISTLNIIVGFGRGFWAGVHDYFYLVYHTKKNRFYWYLRNIESDSDIYFYELDENTNILNLLKTSAIEGNFDEFDDALNYNVLYSLSVGDIKKTPQDMKSTSLNDLFGEDTEQLRIALMNYRPATLGSKYPHKEYHLNYFLPAYHKIQDNLINEYNAGTFEVSRIEDKLFIKLNDDTFELKKI